MPGTRYLKLGKVLTYLIVVVIAGYSLYQFVQPVIAAGGLFFSEYIEGTSYNKALEIFNGTENTIDLAVENYDVQFFSNGSATASTTIPPRERKATRRIAFSNHETISITFFS